MKANIDGIDLILVELGKCVAEKQNQGATTLATLSGIGSPSPDSVDIEDIFGAFGKLSTRSPLDPMMGGLQQTNRTTPQQQTTKNPLLVAGLVGPAAEDEAEAGSGLFEDPWGSSPTEGGPDKVEQSALNPLDPWALGPISGDHKGSKTTTQPTKSTLDPLAPWNLGPLVGGIKGPDVNVRPGQSTNKWTKVPG